VALRSGQLRHRVQIQNLTQARSSDYGDVQDTASPLAWVWASVEPLSGRERWTAQQVAPDVTHRVRMRYRSDVTPAVQLIHNTRTLRVESAINLEERDEQLELLCIEEI